MSVFLYHIYFEGFQTDADLINPSHFNNSQSKAEIQTSVWKPMGLYELIFRIWTFFAVDDIWNVHILVRRNVIRGVKTKNEVQIAFWIFLIIEDF